ncbi:unnamed protein product [Pleuronectes platessa]|uniref:Uncharacterized protein n=1 Tax=Pleuronectes platessa TaxID=8262 RepID=A0A9N7TYM9_PLEPL|nr:unnamed protein product [Pleuronectes platessa]
MEMDVGGIEDEESSREDAQEAAGAGMRRPGVMEPKKSFRTSSALSHACHTAGSALSHPMCVCSSAAPYAGISHSPASLKDNTHHNQSARRHTRAHIAPRRRERRSSDPRQAVKSVPAR